MSEILVVGNCCHDSLVLESGPVVETLGGTVSYVSSVLKFLGMKCEIVSKVGREFKYPDRFDKALIQSQTAPTTEFQASFREGERTLKLVHCCEPIFPEDLPHSKFKVALAGGVAGEVLPETLEMLAQRAEILLCDIQGLIREFDQNGRMSYRRLEETRYAPHLSRLDFLKVSEDEAHWVNLDQIRKRTCVLMTRGNQGCTIMTANHEINHPAWQLKDGMREIDPTGAGDCFLAGFAAGLVYGFSLAECAQLGNRFGAIAVSSPGVPSFVGVDRYHVVNMGTVKK